MPEEAVLKHTKLISLMSFFILISALRAQYLPLASPESTGMDSRRLSLLDAAINKAIEKGDIPGAVVTVVKDFKIIYKKAYGNRQLLPHKESMTLNTIFDMASLTKPMVTATTLMQLIDDGKVRLLDTVEHYLPSFTGIKDSAGIKKPIRIIHLLTHSSGLPAYAHPDMLEKEFGKKDKQTLFHYIDSVPRLYPPGTKFKYSGLNFITLQRIIEQVTSAPLPEYAEKHIFKPLGMQDTGYRLSSAQIKRCAPTELLANGTLLRGIVHDPMARVVMGGLSSNAGLFSTAKDIAVFAAMMLNQGSWNAVRVLSPAAVHTMTHIPKSFENTGRGLGWDLNSAYASNQGDMLSTQTYGHTGYTGTSLVIDPLHNLAIILLTNRVHPHDKGHVVRLRSQVANIVASALINY